MVTFLSTISRLHNDFFKIRVFKRARNRCNCSALFKINIMNRIGRGIKDINAACFFQNLMEQIVVGNIDFCESGAKLDKIFSAFFQNGLPLSHPSPNAADFLRAPNQYGRLHPARQT